MLGRGQINGPLVARHGNRAGKVEMENPFNKSSRIHPMFLLVLSSFSHIFSSPLALLPRDINSRSIYDKSKGIPKEKDMEESMMRKFHD